MFDGSLSNWNPSRLRIWIMLFFSALAVPTGMLVMHAWSQLKWEAFYQHRVMAEELAARIDAAYAAIFSREENRVFTDYAFLNVAGDPTANFLQRSPLSVYPVNEDVPGLVGYFQVDAQGVFTTPLLPATRERSLDYGVSEAELQQRIGLQEEIYRILSDNSLVQAGQVAAPPPGADTQAVAQAAFDQLEEKAAKQDTDNASSRGRVEDLRLAEGYAEAPAAAVPERILMRETESWPQERRSRKEQSVLPERDDKRKSMEFADQVTLNEIRISIFESVVDAFELSLLDSGHLVMFRKVWRNDQRYIQGALINHEDFLNEVIRKHRRESAVARSTDLTVAHAGNVMSVFAADTGGDNMYSVEDLSGELLFQQHLSAPLDDIELIFSINNLPPGPGGSIILWLTAILMLILSSGCYLLYRLGLSQIGLARQQQDFVSAVSHELKTPLTSIRMYGEMLREGWAEEDKKNTYYSYIHDESERLSRLINNVLQLARMTRNDLRMDPKAIRIGALLDTVHSRVSSLVERAGFTLELDCDETTRQAMIEVDIDCFTQVLINLVDNSLKFAAKSELKLILIRCRRTTGTTLQITVRDYGPGIATGHLKKIFRLFYRPENELTRETVGTGIGLALVKQMVRDMRGSIDVSNADPGAEFILTFPLAGTAG